LGDGYSSNKDWFGAERSPVSELFYNMIPDIKPDIRAERPSTALEAGVDYYLERGCWVFTEHYLIKRGWCCGSGCRHCPYRHQQGSTQPIDSAEDAKPDFSNGIKIT